MACPPAADCVDYGTPNCRGGPPGTQYVVVVGNYATSPTSSPACRWWIFLIRIAGDRGTSTPEAAIGIAAARSYLVVDRLSALQIIDISTPESPVIVACRYTRQR
jgi:hypothetical protein